MGGRRRAKYVVAVVVKEKKKKIVSLLGGRSWRFWLGFLGFRTPGSLILLWPPSPSNSVLSVSSVPTNFIFFSLSFFRHPLWTLLTPIASSGVNSFSNFAGFFYLVEFSLQIFVPSIRIGRELLERSTKLRHMPIPGILVYQRSWLSLSWSHFQAICRFTVGTSFLPFTFCLLPNFFITLAATYYIQEVIRLPTWTYRYPNISW